MQFIGHFATVPGDEIRDNSRCACRLRKRRVMGVSRDIVVMMVIAAPMVAALGVTQRRGTRA